MMTPDDSRLTAYVLGELDDAEKAEVEAALERSAACREEVARIRQMTELLSQELASENEWQLTADQKADLKSELAGFDNRREPIRIVTWQRAAGVLAAAAMVALLLTLWQTADPTGGDLSRELAKQRDAQRGRSGPLEIGGTTASPPSRLESSSQSKLRPLSDGDQSEGSLPAKGGQTGSESEEPAAKAAKNAAAPSVESPDSSRGQVANRSRNASTASQPQTGPKSQRNNGQGGGFGGGGGGGFGGGTGLSENDDLAAAGGTQKQGASEEFRRRYGMAPGNSGRTRAVRETQVKQKIVSRERRLSYRRPTATEERESRYAGFSENRFRSVLQAPLSTFSIDVDTASYSNVRRFLREDRLPPKPAVRIEEMINYFDYDYAVSEGEPPLSIDMEVAESPWNSNRRLLKVGLKAKELPKDSDRPSNFVFLIDVSGSMSSSDRLPALKQGLRMFIKQMDPADRVAIVTYASDAERKLASTSGERKAVILSAIDELEANGSTNGEDGMRLAYRIAKENFLGEGKNRVILCTDGDFNVGVTDKERLLRMIRDRAEERIFLTVLGVGTGNYQDSRLLHLADHANGNYHYIDSVEEAYRVLVEEQQATLVTVAKDVKLQIEFNPAQVQSYRLIGYEKRQLANEDFNNDRRDAGDVGAGHTVTALYELVPTGSDGRPIVDELKYQPSRRQVSAEAEASEELLTLKLRYKHPDEEESQRLTFPLEQTAGQFESASTDFRFATAVAAFGMNLRDSRYIDGFELERVREIAQRARGPDPTGARAELIGLIEKARKLKEAQ